MDESASTAYVATCLERLRDGDAAALNQLIARTSARLQRLAAKMFAGFPRLQRWEAADDVFQNATMRLCRALNAKVPESPCAYYRLASMQIRRELIDLARHYFGPQGSASQYESTAPADSDAGSSALAAIEASTDTQNPGRLAEWTEFHRAVEFLPEAERDVFEMIWYQGLKQEEIADLLGIDVRTVQRRWRHARIQLHDHLQGGPTGL
jgi:RNA polymerase sigma-70 factor (ECF subfamily)